MRTSQIIVTIVAICVALTVTLSVAFYFEPSKEDVNPLPEKPEVKADGPFPKVVLDSNTYDFGDMLLGSEESHAFLITNKGEAPLVLTKGGSSCVCTIAELENDTLPVGESVEIQLTWTPKNPNPVFEQSATILTNDPEKSEIKLVIRGRVHAYIDTVPSEIWDMGKITAGTVNSISTKIVSTIVDDFVITGFECELPQIDCTWRELTAYEREEYLWTKGYEIKVIANDGIKVGQLATKLRFKVQKPDGTALKIDKVHVDLKGACLGPVKIRPFSRGIIWVAERQSLDLGSFSATDGTTARLSMTVHGMPDGEFKVSGLDLPEQVAVSLQHQVKGLYWLDIKIKPGSPPREFSGSQSLKIRLKTNHPQMSEWGLNAFYRSN